MKIENSSIGYTFIKNWVKTVMRLVQSKTVVVGRENLPRNKPIIFAANHQNALLDALVVLFATPFQLVWFARADVFTKQTKSILKYLKLSPIYRIRDGKDNLKKNNAVFDTALRVLEKNRQIALFPEGMHSGQRKSVAHKKAVPRIAFMAAEKSNFELDIQIAPTGVYYSHYNALNRYSIVHFGETISLKKYKDQYIENPQQATMALRKEIHDKIIPLTIEIPSKKRYDDYELLRAVLDKPVAESKGLRLRPIDKFKVDQEVLENVEKLGDGEEETNELLDMAKEYGSVLKLLKVDDDIVEMKSTGWSLKWLKYIMFLLLSPIALYGAIMHFIPFTLPTQFVRKKIKDFVFWGTMDIGHNVIMHTLFYILYALVCWFVTKSLPITAAFVITLPFFGKAAYTIKERFIQFRKKLKLQKLLMSKDTRAQTAVMLRSEILNKYFSTFK